MKGPSVIRAHHRKLGQMEMTGEVSYDLPLADKMTETETMSPTPSPEITRIETINGYDVWENQ